MTGPREPFVVALVQHPPVFLDLGATLDRAQDLLREAADGGAQVVVFPETWLPGYPVWIDSAPEAALWGHPGQRALYRLLQDNSVQVGDASFERLRAAAAETETVVVIGAHELHGATLYNTTFTFAADGTDHRLHRKLMPTYTERLLWGKGDGSTLRPLSTPLGVVGGLICWEHWMPLARAAMHATGETLHVAQWPWVHDLHQLCSRQYAFEGQCFVAASGCVLSHGDVLAAMESRRAQEPEAWDLLESMATEAGHLHLRGGSALIGPDSLFVTEPILDVPEIVFGRVDPARIHEGRMLLDTDGHYSRPDVFTLEVDTRARTNVRFGGDDAEDTS